HGIIVVVSFVCYLSLSSIDTDHADHRIPSVAECLLNIYVEDPPHHSGIASRLICSSIHFSPLSSTNSRSTTASSLSSGNLYPSRSDALSLPKPIFTLNHRLLAYASPSIVSKPSTS